MSGVEDPERGDDDVLALAKLELAAAEDGEAIAEDAATRLRAKQDGIHALRTDRDAVDAEAAQHIAVPGGSGEQQVVASRQRYGGARARVLEENHADIRLSENALAQPAGGEPVSEAMKDWEIQMNRLFRRQARRHLALSRECGGEKRILPGSVGQEIVDVKRDRNGELAASEVARQVGPEDAPARKVGEGPADAQARKDASRVAHAACFIRARKRAFRSPGRRRLERIRRTFA